MTAITSVKMNYPTSKYRCAWFRFLSRELLTNWNNHTRHTVIKLTPKAYGCDEERYELPIEAVDTTRYVSPSIKKRAINFPPNWPLIFISSDPNLKPDQRLKSSRKWEIWESRARRLVDLLVDLRADHLVLCGKIFSSRDLGVAFRFLVGLCIWDCFHGG